MWRGVSLSKQKESMESGFGREADLGEAGGEGDPVERRGDGVGGRVGAVCGSR